MIATEKALGSRGSLLLFLHRAELPMSHGRYSGKEANSISLPSSIKVTSGESNTNWRRNSRVGEAGRNNNQHAFCFVFSLRWDVQSQRSQACRVRSLCKGNRASTFSSSSALTGRSGSTREPKMVHDFALLFAKLSFASARSLGDKVLGLVVGSHSRCFASRGTERRAAKSK